MCTSTAVIYEPRQLATALVALASVRQHTPSSMCIRWLMGKDPEQQLWVRAQPLVQLLLSEGRLTLLPPPPFVCHGSDNNCKLSLYKRLGWWEHMPTELVLTFQADSVLCAPLEIERWGEYAQASESDSICFLLFSSVFSLMFSLVFSSTGLSSRR